MLGLSGPWSGKRVFKLRRFPGMIKHSGNVQAMPRRNDKVPREKAFTFDHGAD